MKYERKDPKYKLWKLIEGSINALKNIVHKNNKNFLAMKRNKKNLIVKDRIDVIEIELIFAKIKKVLKEIEKEIQRNDMLKLKIMNHV